MSLFMDDMLQQTVETLLEHPQLWRGQRQLWQNASGIELSRLLWIRPRSAKEQLWAMEQALRAGTCGAVLCWPDASIQFRELRRLQLAAETGNCMGILFNDEEHAGRSTPAALRIRLEPGEHGMDVHLLKGGKPQTTRIEGLQVKEAEV